MQTLNLDRGKIYYYNASGNWALANATDTTKSIGLLAVALGAVSDTNGMLIKGMVTLDHDPGSVGDKLFLRTSEFLWQEGHTAHATKEEAIEEAEAYQALISSHDYTQEELAEIIGKSRSHIANLMRLLNLPASVQELISAGSLTMGQVRPLIGHHDATALAQLILTDNLSARDVEQLIKGMKSGAKAATKNPEKSSDIRALEDKAMQILGLSLSLSWDEAKERGKLSISMSSLEQLDDLMARLGLADDNPS